MAADTAEGLLAEIESTKQQVQAAEVRNQELCVLTREAEKRQRLRRELDVQRTILANRQGSMPWNHSIAMRLIVMKMGLTVSRQGRAVKLSPPKSTRKTPVVENVQTVRTRSPRVSMFGRSTAFHGLGCVCGSLACFV